jgi:hypothetical protein
MDELEILSRSRPELSPEASTVERHRAQLRAAIAASSDSSGTVVRHRPRRRWLVAAAVVGIVVVAVGVWLVSASSTAPRDRVSAPASSVSSLPPVASAKGICGESVPVRIMVPPEFVGPTPGLAADATVTATDDQLVEHWTSPTGSIEIRWPFDVNERVFPDATTPPGSATVHNAVSPDINGRYRRTIYFGIEPQQFLRCQVVQVDVRDIDATQADSTVEYIFEHAPDVDRRFVTNEATVDTTPSAIACAVPAGSPPSPNRGGTVTTSSYPTPRDALQAFVASDATLHPFGYTELHLPDGTTAFGAPAPGGEGFVIVIHVTGTESGWSVDWWDTSGC